MDLRGMALQHHQGALQHFGCIICKIQLSTHSAFRLAVIQGSYCYLGKKITIVDEAFSGILVLLNV